MLTVATTTNNTDLIFPEGAALAFGCWVNREKRWVRKLWHIVAIPTISAGLGVGLNHIAIKSMYREWMALLAVVFLLFILKSSVGPSISAA